MSDSNSIPNNVIINEDTANRVIVDQDAPNLVTVRLSTNSGTTQRHVHTQGVASSEWVITHTLGGYPSVTIVDTSKTYVIGEVKYDSNTQITVTFTAAFSGYAYLT